MWCPNCGAYVATGDVCDRCGASLPAGGGPPRGRTARRNTFGKKPAKEKRAGTLGDLFKTDSPFTGKQAAQKPDRSRGQAFLAWRDARRAGAGVASPKQPAPPKQPARMPPQPPPPQPQRQPDWSSRPSDFPDYTPGSQPPFVPNDPAGDPWNGTYDLPMDGDGQVQVPPSPQADPWAANREWNVMPQSGPPSGPIPGSSSGWRVRSPMVDLDEEDPEWMGIPHYGQNGMPVRRTERARQTAATISRGVMNALLIGLVVVILAIPITIGLSHLASLQPQTTPVVQASGTPVPTAPVPNGFTGYTAPLFSLSYPSGWTHSALDQQLSDGSSAHEDSFTDGQGTTASLYTTLGTASLLQSYQDELASDTAANSPLKTVTQSATRTYNRVKWAESDYTYSGIVNGKPVQMQMRVLGAIQGAAAYFFVLTAPQSSFGHANSDDFEPLLGSFRFY